MTAAALDNHIFVLLENHIAIVQEVQHGDGRKLGGCTAGLGHLARAHQVHQCLDYGVIGRVHMSVEWEIAFSAAVVCVVSVRRDDPIL